MTGDEEIIGIAAYFVRNIVSPDLDLSIFSDDLSVWTPTLGLIGRQDYLAKLGAAHSAWSVPLRMRISAIICRHSSVVLMASSAGVLKNDRKYENEYLFLVDFNDKKEISYVREYFDVEVVKAAYRPVVEAMVGQGFPDKKSG